jgi:Icc-related predicted phosphoesterase
MKILAVSDQEVPSIYSSRVRQQFGDVDLVLACGDLSYSYLEYIVTMLNVPCFFVRGNHDHVEYTSAGHTLTQPGGWTDLDERAVHVRGLLVAGLEGSIRYRPNAPHQHSEREMIIKIWRLAPALLWNRIRHGRYLDILIAHSPAFGIHDGQDRAHRGFRAFLRFMARFRPRYLLHGHHHIQQAEACQTRYLQTEVINVYPFQVIEWRDMTT